MRGSTASRLAFSILGLVAGLAMADAVLLFLNRSSTAGHPYGLPGGEDLSAVVSAGVGALIASRHVRNAIGWIFCAIGLDFEVATLSQQYAIHGLIVAPGSLPGGTIAAWLGSWVYIPGLILMITFLPLLFPDGRLPSPRWRLAIWFMAFVDAGFSLTGALVQAQPGEPHVANFSRFNLTGNLASISFATFGAAGMAFALIAAATIVARLRRARGDEHQQLKWFAFAGALLGIASQLAFAFVFLGGHPLWFEVLFLLATLAVPVSAGIAVFKYRLYDIDVVINRTLVYGVMAAFITSIYVAIVVGIGSLTGRGGNANLLLSLTATAVGTIAFQPVRERVQKLANRLVYGQRATPYEALSRFSERMGEAFAGGEIVGRMAQILAQGTSAARAEVWLRVGSSLRMSARYPDHGPPAQAVDVMGNATPSIPGADRVVPVQHQGELLGVLVVNKRRGEPLTPIEEKLLADLALQAGLALKNVALRSDLEQRLDELRASRQRLVAAQGAERRRLERDLHDGAQQNLVALKVKVALARRLSAKDPSRASELFAGVEKDADEALEVLRDTAHGIYPPLLADRGLVAALEGQSRKAAMPVHVEADGVDRYPQDREAAVYFCCLEALQNAAKYAKAASTMIRLSQVNGELRFSVADDGCGFDLATTARGAGLQNMADRLAALDGRLEVQSIPGKGTTIVGTLPV